MEDIMIAEKTIPKGYKNSALGVIPEDWEVKELQDISVFINGKAFKQEELLEFGKYKVLRVGNVFSSGNWYFSDLELSDEKYVFDGDLMYAWSATFGPKFWKGGKTIFHYHIWKVIANEKVLKNFLYYFLLNDAEKLLNSRQGGTMFHITKGDMEKQRINVPPLYEQKIIANCLSTWDKAIEKLNQLIAKKELRKKGLMQGLLTGKKRLRGFDGEWKEVKLREVFNPTRYVNDGKDGHSIMTISSKLGLISQMDKFERVIAGDSLKKYTQIKRGDFAYNKGNSKTYQMGCIYMLEERESALVPFVYICFSPTDKVCSNFYKHWFLDHGLDRQLKTIITSGARGDGLLNVNINDFFNLKIIYPPKQEQILIAEIIGSADKEIQLLKNTLDQLKMQKKGLMQVLLTGKKRLRY